MTRAPGSRHRSPRALRIAVAAARPCRDLARRFEARPAGIEVVSFDVFDTALRRLVERPEDLFALTACRFRRRTGSALDPDAFQRDRIAAEAAARRTAAAAGRQEVTLAEIYAALAEMDTGYAAVATDLLRAECETERLACRADPTVHAVYRKACAAGRVVFVSDTYLDRGFVAGLLRSCGYTHFDALFVSSSQLATKAHGSLFPQVVSALGIRPAAMLHIGDNRWSDLRQARAAGIRSIWYVPHRPVPPAAPGRGLVASVGSAATRWASAPGHRFDPWDTLGFSCAGPLFLGFALWLRGRVRHFDAERLFFLARDGWNLRTVYGRIGTEDATAVGSGYLYVSRRSLVFPTIDRLDDRAIAFLCSGSTVLPVRSYFDRIGVAIGHDDLALRRAGFASPDEPVVSDSDRDKLRRLMLAYDGPILAAARRERHLLDSYLAAAGAYRPGPIAVADVGWNGTMQAALSKLRSDAGCAGAVHGFYFGTLRGRRLQAGEGTREGFAMEEGRPGRRARAILQCLEIIEFLFSAPHGTVLGYRRSSDRVEPVLDGFDPDGEYARAAAAVRAGMERFVAEVADLFDGTVPDGLSVEEAFAALARLLERPTYEEARRIGRLVHREGFGSAGQARRIAAWPGWTNAVLRPRATLEAWRSAYWKRGLIAQAFHGAAAVYAALEVRRLLAAKIERA